MGIPILARRHIYIETAPRFSVDLLTVFTVPAKVYDNAVRLRYAPFAIYTCSDDWMIKLVCSIYWRWCFISMFTSDTIISEMFYTTAPGLVFFIKSVLLHYIQNGSQRINPCMSKTTTLITRFMGPTRGPSGADRPQVGPMLAPWTLLSGKSYRHIWCVFYTLSYLQVTEVTKSPQHAYRDRVSVDFIYWHAIFTWMTMSMMNGAE